MKRRIFSTLLAATLMVSLTIPANAVSKIPVGSPANGSGGNNQTTISGNEEKTPVFVPSAGGAEVPLQILRQEEALLGQNSESLDKTKATILLTQSTQMEELLFRFQEGIAEETTVEEAFNALLESGVSVPDAVNTFNMSSAAKNSESTTEALDNLSPEIKALVQDAVKEAVPKILEKTQTMMNALQKALEFAGPETEAVDVEALKDAIAAESQEEAEWFGKMIEKLEKKNIIITPEVLEQEYQKQEERQAVLKEIEEGNLDRLNIHSVVDISVSDDIKELVKDGSYVRVSVDLPGVDEDTLLVAVKPVREGEASFEDQETFQQLMESVANGDTREISEKLGNKYIIVPSEVYDGGVTLTLYNFSPVMFLTYSGETEEPAAVTEDVEEAEPAEEAVAEPEENGNMTMIWMVAIVAVIVIGGAIVYKKKKTAGTDEK